MWHFTEADMNVPSKCPRCLHNVYTTQHAVAQRFTGPIEVAMVPGGHFLHREHPEEFLAVLLPFLREDA